MELPWDAAKKAYPYLTYGTLVTVTRPGRRLSRIEGGRELMRAFTSFRAGQ